MPAKPLGDENLFGDDEENSLRDKTQAVGIVPTMLQDDDRTPTLTVIGGRSFGKSFALDEEEMMVGRAVGASVFLDDDGISRTHAKIVRADGEWVVLDLGSTNGTYHDGVRIQAHTLKDGDKIQVGLGTILKFEYQDEAELNYQRSMYESKTRDPLTGAYNRAYFNEALGRELAFSRRHDTSLGLILFDLDHFKKVNDTYGHQSGDLVLKLVSASVADAIRAEDVLARYGGEEFAVILRDGSEEKAFITAERIRRIVERLEIVDGGRRVPCTVSVGATATDIAGHDPEALIKVADELLYVAKENGRNRTEVRGLFAPPADS